MPDSFDLDAYLDRIDWRGGRTPSYETLACVLDAHIRHIPFENFDCLLGRPIGLDLASLQAKLVRARRGGYCFEHASLLAAALEAMGFAVGRHLARVVLFLPPGEAPRDHMYLTVEVEGRRFVLDPGFGPFASRLPIPLDGAATAGRLQMVRDGDLWKLVGQRRGQDFTGWVSRMDEENAVDFEMSNHFTSTHPSSVFRQWIFASAATPTGRVNLTNRDVTSVTGEDEQASRLADRAELRALLLRDFGFDLPEVETMNVAAIPEWTSAATGR